MLSKLDYYSRRYSECLGKAERSPPGIGELWLTVAESYRMLIDFENRYPTRTDGRSGQTGSAWRPRIRLQGTAG
jgi:hypothetical protein